MDILNPVFRIRETREHFCSWYSWNCSRNEFFISYETIFTKRVFSLCSRNECSRNEFFGLLTKRVFTKRLFTAAYETTAGETSLKLDRKSTTLQQNFNKLNFSSEFIHETSFSLCSRHEYSRNEFFGLLTKIVLTKRVFTAAHETSLKLVKNQLFSTKTLINWTLPNS